MQYVLKCNAKLVRVEGSLEKVDWTKADPEVADDGYRCVEIFQCKVGQDTILYKGVHECGVNFSFVVRSKRVDEKLGIQVCVGILPDATLYEFKGSITLVY